MGMSATKQIQYLCGRMEKVKNTQILNKKAMTQDQINELYAVRNALFGALVLECPDWCYKTRKDHQKINDPGWFIVVMNHPQKGQISFHFMEEKWGHLPIEEREYCDDYDEHTTKDVIERLWVNAKTN